jgi:uncharacterized membrane protein YhaH (DUF805 family)
MAIRTRITPALRLPTAARRLNLATGSVGVLATLYFARMLALQGFDRKLEALVGLIVFIVLVIGFMVVPWLMITWLIPFFAVLPTLKVVVSPQVAPLKDVIAFAAMGAAAVLALQRRASRRASLADGVILTLAGGLFLLYLVNAGGLSTPLGAHGIAWFQGVRLFNEPLGMLVAGLCLRHPNRNLAAARLSLIVTSACIALYGVAQQAIGVVRLHQLGFSYGQELRTVGGHLRSFGTLDNTFVYSSLLLLALAVLVVSPRFQTRHGVVVVVLCAGLFVSYVRTALVVALALFGLALARRGRVVAAVFLFAGATVAATIIFVVASEQTQTRAVPINPTTYLTLNGRTQLWRERIGNPQDWPLGRGVGVTGTAAQRALASISGKHPIGGQLTTTNVDSGYLTLISDIGALGLALFFTLFGRILLLSRRAIAAGLEQGWIVVAVVAVYAIDNLSREAFTAYPGAYLTWLLIGLGCAGAAETMRRRSEIVRS